MSVLYFILYHKILRFSKSERGTFFYYSGRMRISWLPAFIFFSHNVFFPTNIKFQFLKLHFFLAICKCFQFRKLLYKILLFGKDLKQALPSFGGTISLPSLSNSGNGVPKQTTMSINLGSSSNTLETCQSTRISV